LKKLGKNTHDDASIWMRKTLRLGDIYNAIASGRDPEVDGAERARLWAKMFELIPGMQYLVRDEEGSPLDRRSSEVSEVSFLKANKPSFW